MLPDLASGPAATGRGFQLSADWVACPNAGLIDMLAVLRLASDELRCWAEAAQAHPAGRRAAL